MTRCLALSLWDMVGIWFQSLFTVLANNDAAKC